MLTRNRPEGDRFWASERRLHYNDLHFHSYYELELVLDGRAHQRVNASEAELSAGTLTFLSPRDFHSIEAPRGETVTYFTLGVCPEELSDEMRAILTALDLPLVLRLSHAQSERLYAMMKELSLELSSAGPYRIPTVQRRIELILLVVAQYATEAVSLLEDAPRLPEGVREIYSVKQYIDSHYSEPLSRSALAASVHYSPSYFSTRFSEVMGMSFSEYLCSVRLESACTLLREKKHTVKDAMIAVGFRSPTLFYRAFRERYGCSPFEYSVNKNLQINEKQT